MNRPCSSCFSNFQFSCCGAKSYEDFSDDYKQNDGSKVLTPIACCKELPANDSETDACAGNTTLSNDVTLLSDVNNYDTVSLLLNFRSSAFIPLFFLNKFNYN